MVRHEPYHFRPNLSVCLVAMATKMLNLHKNIKKNNSSEVIREIKLKLCRIFFIILASIKLLFYCHCLSTLVAVATLNFHRLIMGKMKIGIYCNFSADILTEVFLEMFVYWSSTKHILSVQTSQFDWLSWQPKGSVCEKY